MTIRRGDLVKRISMRGSKYSRLILCRLGWFRSRSFRSQSWRKIWVRYFKLDLMLYQNRNFQHRFSNSWPLSTQIWCKNRWMRITWSKFQYSQFCKTALHSFPTSQSRTKIFYVDASAKLSSTTPHYKMTHKTAAQLYSNAQIYHSDISSCFSANNKRTFCLKKPFWVCTRIQARIKTIRFFSRWFKSIWGGIV